MEILGPFDENWFFMSKIFKCRHHNPYKIDCRVGAELGLTGKIV